MSHSVIKISFDAALRARIASRAQCGSSHRNRKTSFTDRKKQANKKACRSKKDEE